MQRVLWILTMLLITETGFAVSVKPVAGPFFRSNHELNNMRVDPKGRFLAFVPDKSMGLSILDLKSRKIFEVTRHQVGLSFFWSPNGYRLFYREHKKDKNGELISVVNAFDTALGRNVKVDELPFRSGVLTFDPRDLRMHLLTQFGIRTKRIYFPDERLARWQVAQRTENGKWIVTQNGVVWLTGGGSAMRKLPDDGTPIQSYDISPDGQSIAWATERSRIYVATNGRDPKLLDHGRDPQWHPDRSLLLYAGARMVGNTPVSYDLKISDKRGSARFLTSSQHSNERWPQWHPRENQIIFTKEKTTDVFVLDFVE